MDENSIMVRQAPGKSSFQLVDGDTAIGAALIGTRPEHLAALAREDAAAPQDN